MADKPQKYKDLSELVTSTIFATAFGASTVVSYMNDVPYLPIALAGLATWNAIDAAVAYQKVKKRL